MALLRWNKDFALEQAADDKELLAELLDIFKISFAEDLQVMRDGLANNDPAMIAGAAHSIKGASASLGIDGIAELAKRVEEDGMAGGVSEAGSLLPRLEQMLEEINSL